MVIMNSCELYLLFVFYLALLHSSFCDSDERNTLNENVICPKNCSCTYSKPSSLALSCSEVPQGDYDVVIRRINQVIEFYSGNVSDVNSVAINNSPIKDIPMALCKGYKNLRVLNLDKNRLNNISTECFRNKKLLEKLSLSNNLITRIDTTLLHNLGKLTELDLSYNLLEYIASETFKDVGRSSLSLIHLQNNKLKSFGVWPFSQSVKDKDLTVDVQNNKIDKIINEEGFYTSCSKILDSQLTFYLDGNKIVHLADIFGAFLRSITELHCIFISSRWRLLSIIPRNLYCDCIDYKFYLYIKTWVDDVTLLSKIQCIDKYRKAVIVQLNEMTCSVKEFCPSGCYCTNQPSNNTYHVSCTNSGATNFPKSMPPRDNPKSFFMPTILPEYKLDFSHCNITEIEERSYFSKTKWLDLSNSNVHNITDDAWISIKNIKVVFLNNNQLTTLPQSIQDTNLTIKELHLYNNPFSCNCEDKWLKDWLTANSDRLPNPLNILCHSPSGLAGQSILALQDTQLCAVPKQLTIPLIIVIPIVSVIILIVGMAGLLFRFRIQLFSKIHIHPFDRDECEGEEMDYDVMISFSHFDHEVAFQILNFLEQKSYKVCYAPRDFIPGMSIMDNIIASVNRSKRTLCLISDSYITRPYCIEEFDWALHRDAELTKHRIIALVMGDVLTALQNSLVGMAAVVEQTEEEQTENLDENEREHLLSLNEDDNLLELENIGHLEDNDIAANPVSSNGQEDGRLLNDDEMENLIEHDDYLLEIDNSNRLEQEMENLIDIREMEHNMLSSAPINLNKLTSYLKDHTYIEYQSTDWESKLLYALPINKMTQEP